MAQMQFAQYFPSLPTLIRDGLTFAAGGLRSSQSAMLGARFSQAEGIRVLEEA
jgi:hypothetical protein